MAEQSSDGSQADLLARLHRLHGVTWEWRDDEAVRARGLAPGTTAAGVIAQDVEGAFPELVATDGEGYKSVDYNGLIAVLIEAVKTLDVRVQALESSGTAVRDNQPRGTS